MDEVLECAITPGMPSFLYAMPQLKNFSEKTIRWPGHWQAIDTLKECGILDLDPFEFKDATIRPRDIFLSLVEPKLRPMPGDQDICVMWNTATGPEKRVDYYMWAKADTENGISAMARVTGSFAAIGQGWLAKAISEKTGLWRLKRPSLASFTINS
jgi:saccharopine dehydrogenase-like NADP-dependent oxidoreductase